MVDDHPANRLLMCQQLGFLGHSFSTAQNGATGLQAWKDEHFDLVIVDCNMPVLNGYEMTRRLREHEASHDLPACAVFGFTANAQPEERTRCKEAGMNDCLFKPISLTTLNQKLADVTPRPRRAAFSLDGLRALTGGEPLLMRRLIDELLSSCQADREELLGLPISGNLIPLIDMAHKIKGAARIAQANELVEHCTTLETECQEEAPTARIEAARQAIVQALLELETALREHTDLPPEKMPGQ